MASVFQLMADTETFAVSLTRLGLIVVLFWIGGLKIAPYEADGIVPFVAESPFMSFLMDGKPPVAPGARHLHGFVHPRRDHRQPGHSALLPTLAAAGGGRGRPAGFRHVPGHAFLSDYHAPGLGARPGRRGARFPLPERQGTAGAQGCRHDGRGPGLHGRFGKKISAPPRRGQLSGRMI